MPDADGCGGTPGHPALITLASTPAGDQTVNCPGCPDCAPESVDSSGESSA